MEHQAAIIEIAVQQAGFDAAALQQKITANRSDIGAIVSFTGLVRDFNEKPDVLSLTLEHYPGMTEKALFNIAESACQRWSIQALTIVHRVGCLVPADPIVLVMVASAHRQDAFDACAFVMDYLKTEAPFWKKENTQHGDYWVSARASDQQARTRWEHSK